MVLARLMTSMKMMPGSPVDQALLTMRSKRAEAFDLLHRLFGPGIEQGKFLALVEGLHKGVGDGDGDIEIGQFIRLILTGDKFFDIRVINPENGHVGPPPGAPLLDGFGGDIENIHEGDGTGGHALGGKDPVVFGADAGEGKAGAAAAFVNQGGVFDGLEDAGDIIVHRQHETGGQLPQLPAGIHQGGRVGHKGQGGHEMIKLAGRFPPRRPRGRSAGPLRQWFGPPGETYPRGAHMTSPRSSFFRYRFSNTLRAFGVKGKSSDTCAVAKPASMAASWNDDFLLVDKQDGYTICSIKDIV